MVPDTTPPSEPLEAIGTTLAPPPEGVDYPATINDAKEAGYRIVKLRPYDFTWRYPYPELGLAPEVWWIAEEL